MSEGADPPVSTAFLLMAVGRRIRDRIERALSSEGIALRHVSALGHLSRTPGLSYSELARRASVTPQSMQATLRTLEDRGAIERAGEGGRGRTATLTITAEGRRLLDVGTAAITAADDEIDAALDDRFAGELRMNLLSMMRGQDTAF
ncbi:MarR family winged helix-turn-helix transcriptional regulator [Gordonia sp. OPL2]|uniref:MarR family winged helix-turn-helix transcriptional regulator n=1 Tax=Gordonia sp. OPL2 TaxID=2486274 RepID=UPI0021CD0931|nr:MarR family transcriptional regulator [Gordonia sp. OPL2]